MSLPKEYLGAIISDITGARRGQIVKLDDAGEGHEVKALLLEVPLKEMIGYSTTIRSMTKGTASYSMEFLKYGDLSNNQHETLLKHIRGF